MLRFIGTAYPEWSEQLVRESGNRASLCVLFAKFQDLPGLSRSTFRTSSARLRARILSITHAR